MSNMFCEFKVQGLASNGLGEPHEDFLEKVNTAN